MYRNIFSKENHRNLLPKEEFLPGGHVKEWHKDSDRALDKVKNETDYN